MYEMAYYLTPLILGDKIDDETNALRLLIESQKGVITYEDRPKMKDLSYPINKLEKAYFGLIKFIANPEALTPLEESIKKSGKIIRFLITCAKKAEKKAVKPRNSHYKQVSKEEKSGVKVEEIDKKIEELIGD